VADCLREMRLMMCANCGRHSYLIAHFCQGRFGNQFDYLLHLLDLAARTRRTLVLPPYTDYSAQEVRLSIGSIGWCFWQHGHHRHTC
jgi:hypothetical protein